ncbi:MAG: GNAT family N-acetyltransferase [Prevotellaceae bacterium]|jgi:hypothetical protein|nr:GNAT family N-acetyltransferase [Prevotellaceae bacterium]
MARFITAESADYLDFKGIEEVDCTFFKALKKELNDRDVAALLLSNVMYNSHFYQSAHAFYAEAMDIECTSSLGIICPNTNIEDYFTTIGRETKRNLKRIRKNCTKAGMVFRYNSINDDALSWIFDHQEQRSLAANYSAIKNTVAGEILKQQAKANSYNIAWISCNGVCTSGMLIMQDNKTLAVYIQAFDKLYGKYYPSLFLLTKLTEYAITHGYEYLDLLRGEELYKKRLCNHSFIMKKILIPVKQSADWEHIVPYVKKMIE